MQRKIICALIAAFPLVSAMPSLALAGVASAQLTCNGLGSGTCTASAQNSSISGSTRNLPNFVWEGTNVAVTQTSPTVVSYICNANPTTGLAIIKAYNGIDLETGKEAGGASVVVCQR